MDYVLKEEKPKTMVQQSYTIDNSTSTKSIQLTSWRKEIDEFYEDLMNLNDLQPDQVFERISAYSARVSYIRSQISRSETKSWANFRIKEVDHFLRECEFQFKVHSRLLSVKNFELDVGRYDT